MEKSPISTKETQPSHGTPEFNEGSPVIYALHGKCIVSGIETRQMGGQELRFYKLEVQKSALSRSTRQEPAIWVPVETARERGLRAPVSPDDVAPILEVLSSREYYFDRKAPWATIQPQLEAAIRNEGAIGLAKVISYLYVVRKRQAVPSTEVQKMYEVTTKLLLRELTEASKRPSRDLEATIAKGLKSKLTPDN